MNLAPDLPPSQTTIVICSANRTAILEETIRSLWLQDTQPVAIIVSVPDELSVSEKTKNDERVRTIKANRGLTTQRNASLEYIRSAYTLFLDDDVEISPRFIWSMEHLFGENEGFVLASAVVIADGSMEDAGISRERARVLLDRFVPASQSAQLKHAYGCNMFVRTAVAKAERFDEALPLYGWLEDLDFSNRCRRIGGIVRNMATGVVHLGASSGRMSGFRFGYSQIANPLYLWSRSTGPSIWGVLLFHWCKFLFVNTAYYFCFWLDKRNDRPGRLAGNVAAFADFAKGTMHPTRILQLSKPAG